MNDNHLFTLLKQFKALTPSQDFLARSKQMIFAREQHLTPREAVPACLSGRQARLFEGAKFVGALVLASFLLFVVLGTLSHIQTLTPSLANALNKDALQKEATSLEFQMRIKEATYYTETAEQVAIALDKIADTKSPSSPTRSPAY